MSFVLKFYEEKIDSEAMKNENEVGVLGVMVRYGRQKWHFPMLRSKKKQGKTNSDSHVSE